MRIKVGVACALALLLAACAPTASKSFGLFLSRANAQGVPLLIYAYGVPGEIAVSTGKGAVPVYVQFVVTANMPIRHIRFTLLGFTTRGDAVRNNNGLRWAVVMTGPGPFSPGRNYEVNSFHSTPAGFPGGNVACVKLTAMQIVYANGQSRSYHAGELTPLLLPPLRRGCHNQGITVSWPRGVYRAAASAPAATKGAKARKDSQYPLR